MRRPVDALVGFADRLFGPLALWVDLKLTLLSAGWFVLMICKPAMFDRGVLAGLSWLPDEVWILLMGALAVGHGVGLVRPWWRNLRTGASLTSAWVWLFVATSLGRVEISTGVLNYAVVGAGALFSAIYLSGLARERG